MKTLETTSIDSLRSKAFHLVKAKRIHSTSKQVLKLAGLDAITSIGTERLYVDCIYKYLDWRRSLRLSIDGPHLEVHMHEFMQELCEDGRDQRYLNSVRQALQKTFDVKLQIVESESPVILTSRAYDSSAFVEILKFQSESNALTSRLCWDGGLRAHEAYTLQRASEVAPSAHRDWSEHRFAFMSDVAIYTVRGKGGLARNVAIPVALANELEQRRLPIPITRRSRGINYQSFYEIGGGASFSQSFSRASMLAVGYSYGAHGCRHSYAQRRMKELKAGGFDTPTAMLVLSQELGHFRPEIVLAYLR